MRTRAVVLSFLSLVLVPAIGSAQERPAVGLTMGFPTAAGLIWHATDRIALSPAITFVQVTSKVDATLPNASTESTSRSLGLGARLLWYLGASDHDVRPYLSPAVVYDRATSDDEDEEPVGLLTVSGSVGVQYTPSPRVGLFGEVGLGRARTERTSSFPSITVTSSVTTWSIRSAVGVVFYLGG
jgi:hypothetical protein